MRVNRVLQQVVASTVMIKVLECLEANTEPLHLTNIKESADLPYVPTHEVKVLESVGLVITEARGRPLYVELTPKGSKFIDHLRRCNDTFDELFDQ